MKKIKPRTNIRRFEKPRYETCALCGKTIRGAYNFDHIFPRAIAKWCFDNDPGEVIELIYNSRNKVKTHIRCNSEKAERIVPVSSLYLSKFQRRYFNDLEKQLTPYVVEFNKKKARVTELQDGKCRCCGCILEKEHSILRRYDCTKERDWNNACVVCEICNKTHEDFVHRIAG